MKPLSPEKRLLRKISKKISELIYPRTKSKCPNCGTLNYDSSRLLMRDIPTFNRVCDNCKHEWETNE